MGMTYEEKGKKVIELAEHYGLYNQLIKAIEEHSELIQVLAKYWQTRLTKKADEKYKKLIIGEYADCWITIAQVIYLMDIKAEDIEEAVKYKLDRQLERIANEH